MGRRLFHQGRSEEHTSELQSPCNLVCRLLLEKKKNSKQAASASASRYYNPGKTSTDTSRGLTAVNVPVLSTTSVSTRSSTSSAFFFFNDTATTEIYTLSLHDALPISFHGQNHSTRQPVRLRRSHRRDRKSTRLNSSHLVISYAVFCLKKKKKKIKYDTECDKEKERWN